MAGKNKSNLVATIRQKSISLISVAEHLGLPIVKSGASTKTFCPFNAHKQPKLELYDAPSGNNGLPHFHCFACGAHGDAFDLVKEVKGVDFSGAVDWLAQRYGIEKNVFSKTGTKKRTTDVGPDNGFLRALGIYRQSGDRGKAGVWLKTRLLPVGILDRAEIAHAAPYTLSNAIESGSIAEIERRVLQDELETTGLVRRARPDQSASSEYLDLQTRFRDFFFDERIIFPIRTATGALVGFAGRSFQMDSSGKIPKYLYTPKLPRGSVLYRADYTFPRVCSIDNDGDQYRDLFICEGLVDALRLESLGFNAVALLGAQITTGQLALIDILAEQLPAQKTLRCFVFLDSDAAGRRGAGKSIAALIDQGIQTVFVCPPNSDKKDPDEILKDMNEAEAKAAILCWSHPPALALLADQLGVSCDDIIDEAKWDDISISRRYHAARKLSKSSLQAGLLFFVPNEAKENKALVWCRDAQDYRDSSKQSESAIKKASSTEYIKDSTARLNHARSLAKSGAQRGEVPSDEATWQRIDIAATAFNEAFKTRLQQKIFTPLEPFDAVQVSRGFGKPECRLKAMPCPEDLIVQQYMLNELLSERLDSFAASLPFSRHIPAVRYYRGQSPQIITTAETPGGGEQTEPLSFAYQIDMDVLEGNCRASDQGMFRPYFECWRDFNLSLRRQSRKMTQVHVVRLDLTRYYDRLSRSTVRDALKRPLNLAFNSPNSESCAELFLAGSDCANTIVDWICDQSFGFYYYDPTDGKAMPKPGSEHIGIPQGPILSAWLATIALFPLDAAMRSLLAQLNADGITHAGYARYVDDVVLLADSPAILSVLRGTAEDAIRRLSLEISQKGERIPPLSPDEFADLLSGGRAFVGSGPTWEPELMHPAAPYGSDGLSTRAISLLLLSDPQLYKMDGQQFHDQIYTAMHANDLRPGDLAKVSSKIWFLVARSISENDSAPTIWEQYWTHWNDAIKGVDWILEPEKCAWDDPALYALDGLEALIKAAHIKSPSLSDDDRKHRVDSILRLARIALTPEFIEEFCEPLNNTAPPNTGKGVLKLSRMFWQRCLALRWKMWLILNQSNNNFFAEMLPELGTTLSKTTLSKTTLGSLARGLITEIETTGNGAIQIAQGGGYPELIKNDLRAGVVWLHQAIALFKIEKEIEKEIEGKSNNKKAKDPLFDIAGNFKSDVLPSWQATQAQAKEINDNFFPLLSFFLPDNAANSYVEDEQKIDPMTLALATLTAISQRATLLQNLENRPRLINLNGKGRLQPSLPGIKPDALLLISQSDTLAEDAAAWTIEKVRLITLNDQTNTTDQIAPHSFKEVAPDGATVTIPMNWSQSPDSTDALAIQYSSWPSSANQIWVTQPPAGEADVTSLRFVADAFDALAKINYALRLDRDDDGITEYVPAWPYIAASALLGAADQPVPTKPTFALVCIPVKQEAIAGFGYVRDGTRGLTTVRVTDRENEWLWRIGFAITDLLGLRDGIDNHNSDNNDISNESQSVQFEPATYMVRAMLRRLRGEFYFSNSRSQKSIAAPHLPVSLERCLSLLRSYPVESDVNTGICYVLAVEWENRLMAQRLNNAGDFNGRGEAAYLLERNAINVFAKLPASWGEALPSNVGEQKIYYRRTVSAWLTINQRVALLLPQVAATAPPGLISSAWQTLSAGLRLAAVVEWIRALAFELAVRNFDSKLSDFDIANLWGIESPMLMIDADDEDICALFKEATSATKNTSEQLAKITPLGWLALVASKIGLFAFGIAGHGGIVPGLQDKIMGLAQQLAPIPHADIGNGQWPFEYCQENIAEWDEKFLDDALDTLGELDVHLKFTVHQIDHRSWGYHPSEGRFIDASDTHWPIKPTQIRQLFLGDKRTEEYQREENSPLRKIWTETRNQANELIGISVLGRRFSELAPYPKNSAITANAARTSPLASTKLIAAVPQPVDMATAIDVVEIAATVNDSAPPEPPVPQQNSDGDKTAVPKTATPSAATASEPSTIYNAAPNKARQNWQSDQARNWIRRITKASGHIRIALLQMRVDDSYRHPIIEAGWPMHLEDALDPDHKKDRQCERSRLRAGYKITEENSPSVQLTYAIGRKSGEESQWRETAILPSWAEHRRRCFLMEALRACDSFGVDILVLPEYSLRPDTIAWLKRLLAEKGSSVSVVAGTYRIHGKPGDGLFKKRFQEIFGEADHFDMFEKIAPLKAEPHSMEKTAYITLLAPLTLPDKRHLVNVFTRPKKYPAVAMTEFIRPGTAQWEPLFTLEKLLSFIEHSRKFTSDTSSSLSAKDFLKIVNQFIPMRCIAELICSELFLPTSPTNLPAIASEYAKLLALFGIKKDLGNAYGMVKTDLDALTAAMSPTGFFDTFTNTHQCIFPRRSILIVPALTSRSADYWIHGQSALLSAGVTTVFCTGTGGKDLSGGSCFIGRNSWQHKDGGMAGMQKHITPYAGWSHGIYYNGADDALGKDIGLYTSRKILKYKLIMLK